jgi:hypothetical protein
MEDGNSFSATESHHDLAPALALTLIITATALLAQVPQLPNYQRRVAVGK